MCTATYVKDPNNRIIFTTNRDEHAARPTQAPAIHMVNDQKLLFPRDELAGGSWVAVNQKGWIACMMNGAEGEQEWLGTTAKKSRGQVLLDSFQANNALEFFAKGAFEEAHPFTLILIQPTDPLIYTLHWNGTKKWLESFDASEQHIWSAYTLYPEEQRKARSEAFQSWKKNEHNHTAEAVFQLHNSAKENGGLLLQDSGKVDTVSITQTVVDSTQSSMRYFDIQTQESVEAALRRLS